MRTRNEFDRRMARMQRSHKIMSVIVLTFIAFAFLCIVAYFGAFVYVAYKAATIGSDVGIQGILKQLYCGANAACELPQFLK